MEWREVPRSFMGSYFSNCNRKQWLYKKVINRKPDLWPNKDCTNGWLFPLEFHKGTFMNLINWTIRKFMDECHYDPWIFCCLVKIQNGRNHLMHLSIVFWCFMQGKFVFQIWKMKLLPWHATYQRLVIYLSVLSIEKVTGKSYP